MLSVMSLTSALLHFQISALTEPQNSDGGQREAELQQVCLFFDMISFFPFLTVLTQ